MLPDSAKVARQALHAAAERAEIALSVLRAIFCVLITTRFGWIHFQTHVPHAAERAMVLLPATGSGLGFSLWLLNRVRQQRAIAASLLTLSVVFDSIVCTAAIVSNVLWPWPEYPGILMLPETIMFVVLVLAAFKDYN